MSGGLAECDISVSKLLGFETFPFFGIDKSIRYRSRKNVVLEFFVFGLFLSILDPKC